MSLLRLENRINRFSDILGALAAVLFILLLLNVFFDVVMRYVFNDVSIGMQEMEWHLFATIFLISIPYALRHSGHVRVDVIFERLSPKRQAWVDLFGTLIFLLPFTLLVAYYGIDFAYESYELGEQSGDPGGLPYRWIIKSMISLAFTSIAISGVGMLLHSINTIRGLHPQEIEETPFTKNKGDLS